jgi:mycoredoxin
VTDHAVTVFHKPRCPFAAKLRLQLRVARIAYRIVDFTKDEAAAASVRAANDGDELSPTVRVGERFLSNPSLEEVRRAMHDEASR